jgi:hypothetical protein
MNPASVLERPLVTPIEPELPAELVVADVPKPHVGFGTWLARAVPTTMAFIFVLATVGLYAYRGDFLGALGVGSFLAAWIGFGVGFLIAGIKWGLQYEDTH